MLIASLFLAACVGAGPLDLTGPEKLVVRVAPKLADKVVLNRVVRKEGASEYFELSTDVRGRLVVEGNSDSALTAGFGHFLRHVLKADFFWEGAADRTPATRASDVPRIDGRIRKTAAGTWRAHFNFCTISYSLAFADWNRWERELDILALHGVNLPLSVVGLECTWYETLRKLGWSDAEAKKYVVGPPFQAWQWMTNMESENGPVPQGWLDRCRDLGRRIIARELELGMTPMQEGFTGCVPDLAKRKFPQAKIASKKAWYAHRPTPAQLDPLDPLFPVFARTFYETQRELFGAYGFYATDPFHEGVPPVEGDEYLGRVGAEIARAVQDSDPNGVACMQAWSLRMPIVRAFPKGRLLILDIGGSRAEMHDGFGGVPFVSGLIWNFGGRTHSGGSLKDLAANPFAAAKRTWLNCIGSGLFPEGIHTSPLYFALALDLQWSGEAADPKKWLDEYLTARYRVDVEEAGRLSGLLLKSLYSGCPSGGGSIFAARPQLDVSKADPNRLLERPADERALLEAWEALTELVAKKGEKAPAGLRYDLADVVRAASAGIAFALHDRATNAWTRGDAPSFRKEADRFLDLMADLDAFLAQEPLLDFAHDLKVAEACGTTPSERALYSQNETLLLTQWGPFREPSFYDYAWREWSGLLRGYYAPRWKMFFEAAERSLTDPAMRALLRPEQDKWKRPANRANAFYSRMADFEEGWIADPNRLARTPVRPLDGTLPEISRTLLRKWSPFAVAAKRTDSSAPISSEVGGRLGDE